MNIIKAYSKYAHALCNQQQYGGIIMSITREKIIEKLSERYPALTFVPTTVVKNTFERNAIIIRNNTQIAPTIYCDDIINNVSTLDEAVAIICNIIDQESSPDIDISQLTNKDFLLTHVRIGIQRASNEDLVKSAVTDFPGIEQYLYILGEPDTKTQTSWSAKITPDLLISSGMEEEKIWDIARENTFSEISLEPMSNILSELFENDLDMASPTIPSVDMYVISNSSRCKGASSILNHELLERFAKEHCPSDSETKAIVVLPSSIHECILLPVSTSICIEEFSEMVREVNSTLSPNDILVDNAFIVYFS